MNLARYKIECCYNCEDRKAECHSNCEAYKEQKAEYDETMAEVKRKVAVRRVLNQQACDGIDKVYKRLHRKGW